MKCLTVFFVLFLSCGVAFGQFVPERIDSAMMARIRDEGMNRSHAAETLEGLTDYCGARLSWSPEFKAATTWVMNKLNAWHISNVHTETFTPDGRAWSIKRFSAHMIEPRVVPLIGVPKAWSPGTNGTVQGKAILFDVKSDSDLAKYTGKLKKAFVFIADPKNLELNFHPFAVRDADSTLLKLANADARPMRRRGRAFGDSTMIRRFREEARLNSEKLALCLKEGAYAVIDATRGDGGTIMTGAASVPQPPAAPAGPAQRINAYDVSAPRIPPQVSLAAEQYNRIVRLLMHDVPVTMEMELDVNLSDDAVPGMNVIGEIPGTDLKDEVVMIGAHLDSWHPGTGACDNGTGVTTAMEAMRILSALGVKPRRTIRIGLWGGEEQGLFGSRAYVAQHFGEREKTDRDQTGSLTTKPEYDRFCAYFNDDNGSGRFRGIYLQGDEAARSIFRAWLAPFADLGASTITSANTGGTDHLSFDAIGLPGFQFIQDPLEYGRTYHTNFDVYERASEEDLKQSAIIMASFAFDAAMGDQKLPHIPIPPTTR
ncbi:MAG: M20/M25/M40 family metallo-hydrolase [Bacteroidota bacterium]